ncbi:MAG: hypothetical protein ABWZ25_18985 [Chitinophagaceae bacterium]
MLPQILLVFFLLNFFSANAQLVNYDDRGKVRILSSFLVVQIDTNTVQIREKEQSVVAGSLISPVINLGAAVIGEAIKHGAQKYSSILTATASAAGFWLSESQLSLPVLTIRRMVMLPGSERPEQAFSIVLRPELSADRTAFRFVLKDPFQYKYSGVRTKGKFDYVNIELLISLRALVIEEGEYKTSELRSSSIAIPAVKAGSTYDPSLNIHAGGWFPFPPRPSFLIGSEEVSEISKTVSTNGTSNGKPDNDTLTTVTRTIEKTGTGAQVLSRRSGNYEITVELVEINPYKGRAVEREKVTNAGLEPLAELLKEAAKK